MLENYLTIYKIGRVSHFLGDVTKGQRGRPLAKMTQTVMRLKPDFLTPNTMDFFHSPMTLFQLGGRQC